ncbi:glycoside hydrolase family 31 protein [Streptomyces libani]
MPMPPGTLPRCPEWALGLWQSRLRYRTQEELLGVAREYQRRGLPLSVIAVDFFHWPHLGDWRFDAADWPDPAGMVAELASMGVRPLVSVWPSVSVVSENYPHMRDERLLLGTEHGQPFQHVFPDSQVDDKSLPVVFYDPTDERARDYIWSRIKRNYYDLGFRLWWLDACEPEMYPEQLRQPALRGGARPGGGQLVSARTCAGIFRAYAGRRRRRSCQPGAVRLVRQPGLRGGSVVG